MTAARSAAHTSIATPSNSLSFSTLSSLLLRDGILDESTLRRALEKQRACGDSIDTVLLEMAALPEDLLSHYLARTYGLLSLPSGSVMNVPKEVLRLVPAQLAAQRRIVPVQAERRLMQIATAAPLRSEDRRSLAFFLGHQLEFRIVTRARIEAALAKHYQLETDPRLAQLVLSPPRAHSEGWVQSAPLSAPPQTARILQWATQRLLRLDSRDEVLEVLCRVAAEFFEYAALFVVFDDIAAGKEAVGSGPSREQLQSFALPLDLPSSFQQVKHSGEPRVVDLGRDEVDRWVAEQLRRETAQPSYIAPLLVQERVVMLIYGDRGGRTLDLQKLAGLTTLLPQIGEAFERIIQRRKHRLRRATPRSVLLRSHAAWRPSGGGEVDASEPPAPAAEPLQRRHSDTYLKPPSAPPARAEAERRVEPANPAPSASLPPPARPSKTVFLGAPEDADDEVFKRETLRVKAPSSSEGRSPTPTLVLPATVEESGDDSLPDFIPENANIIVDMGAPARKAVEALLACDPAAYPEAFAQLLPLGEAALPLLVAAFPGPRWSEAALQAAGASGPLHEAWPCARALVDMGERALPYLAALVGRASRELRLPALSAAHALAHPQLIEVTARCLLDDDAEVRAAALNAMRSMGLGSLERERALRALRILARTPQKHPRDRWLAMRALGALGDTKSLGLFIDLLRAADPEVKQHARQSLTLLTAHDLGPSFRKWSRWAEQKGELSRIEWLIDSLDHTEESLRAHAGEELQALTQEYYGFHPALAKRERQVIARRYRRWWEEKGRYILPSA